MIKVTCPNPACGKLSAVQDEFAGKQAKCPACGTVMTVPSITSIPAGGIHVPESLPATSTPPSEPAAPGTAGRSKKKFMAWTAVFGHAKTIALVNFVLAALSIVAGLWIILVPGELAATKPAIATNRKSAERAEEFAREFARAERAATPRMVTFFQVLGILMMLWGAMAIADGIGLSNRRNWGRVLALVLAGFAGVLGLAALVPVSRAYFAFLAAAIAYLAYAAWLFLAMTKPARPKEGTVPHSP